MQLIRYIEQYLQGVAPADEVRETAWYIAEEITGLSRTDIIVGKGTTFFENIQTQLPIIAQRLAKNEPLQYIFGRTLWRGMMLRVSPATLIPRPETAELVDWVLEEEGRNKKQEIRNKKQEARSKEEETRLRVLDCGTGSGCIAIALKKERPTWDVTGVDISVEALQIAQENAGELPITFRQLDLLSEELPYADIIVANPPYICMREKADMKANVLDYEPHTALFVSDDDPLLFYRRIAEQKKAPLLYFEINQYHYEEMIEMLRGLDYSVTLRYDIYDNPRMIKALL